MNKLKMCKIPLTNFHLFLKFANSGSWSITADRDENTEHTIHIGFMSEERSYGKVWSFIIGPLSFGWGFWKLKE